ncbi:hypothetical protein JTE90_012906 [Oedothorax gibbosus]|uniref:Uncharacterized protein n=1 Tax=Oedothorax gibbosus TaxID=931172 RepID=A0AAV6UE39_9ARAC|nr:hypothetical protein JTE90_012906 [Oedothorax gibbosus]
MSSFINFGISDDEFDVIMGEMSEYSGVNAPSTSNPPAATPSNNSRTNAPAIIYSPIFGPRPPAAHTSAASPPTIPKTLAPSVAPTFVHATPVSPPIMPRTPSATPALAYDLPSTSAGPQPKALSPPATPTFIHISF